jgi:hypothetical protein
MKYIKILLLPFVAITVNCVKYVPMEVKNNQIAIRFQDFKKIKNIINLKLKIKNISKDTLWICSQTDFEHTMDAYCVHVDANKGRMDIGIKSYKVNPVEIFQRPPIAVYKRLLINEEIEFNKTIQLPVRDSNDRNIILKTKNIKRIDIALGYLNQEKINTLNEYIQKRNKETEILLSAYWTAFNNENLAKLYLTRKIIFS